MTYIHIEPEAFKEVSMFKWVHILHWFSNQAPRAYSGSTGINPGFGKNKASYPQKQESQVQHFSSDFIVGGPWDI